MVVHGDLSLRPVVKNMSVSFSRSLVPLSAPDGALFRLGDPVANVEHMRLVLLELRRHFGHTHKDSRLLVSAERLLWPPRLLHSHEEHLFLEAEHPVLGFSCPHVLNDTIADENVLGKMPPLRSWRRFRGALRNDLAGDALSGHGWQDRTAPAWERDAVSNGTRRHNRRAKGA